MIIPAFPSTKQRLINGEKLNGCWIGMFSAIASEIIALSGYDVGIIDLEHGPGSFTEAVAMMHALNNHRCTAMVRASSSNMVDIKRALDIGPAGLMVPNVRNAGEATEVVAACRYGPQGVRGAAPRIIRASSYGKHITEYLDFMATEFLLIAQIESAEAVEQVDEIAAVDGIDMLFIGPTDLSAALGQIGQYDSDRFKKAIKKIEVATLAAGKLLGTIPFPGWDAERLYQNGHSLVLSGSDLALLQQAAEADVMMTRAAAGKAD